MIVKCVATLRMTHTLIIARHSRRWLGWHQVLITRNWMGIWAGAIFPPGARELGHLFVPTHWNQRDYVCLHIFLLSCSCHGPVKVLINSGKCGTMARTVRIHYAEAQKGALRLGWGSASVPFSSFLLVSHSSVMNLLHLVQQPYWIQNFLTHVGWRGWLRGDEWLHLKRICGLS